MITIFYIIETILIYFYSLGFSLNARPHKRQRFNHHCVEIKVVVVVVVGAKQEPGMKVTRCFDINADEKAIHLVREKPIPLSEEYATASFET